MFLEIVLRKILDIPCKNSNKNEKNLEILLFFLTQVEPMVRLDGQLLCLKYIF